MYILSIDRMQRCCDFYHATDFSPCHGCRRNFQESYFWPPLWRRCCPPTGRPGAIFPEFPPRTGLSHRYMPCANIFESKSIIDETELTYSKYIKCPKNVLEYKHLPATGTAPTLYPIPLGLLGALVHACSLSRCGWFMMGLFLVAQGHADVPRQVRRGHRHSGRRRSPV